jgi:hypothetical protein
MMAPLRFVVCLNGCGNGKVSPDQLNLWFTTLRYFQNDHPAARKDKAMTHFFRSVLLLLFAAVPVTAKPVSKPIDAIMVHIWGDIQTDVTTTDNADVSPEDWNVVLYPAGLEHRINGAALQYTLPVFRF